MNFHCNGNKVKKVANMIEETKCSFKGSVDSGEYIFVSSKNCLNGIDKEKWNLEVNIRYFIYNNM